MWQRTGPVDPTETPTYSTEYVSKYFWFFLKFADEGLALKVLIQKLCIFLLVLKFSYFFQIMFPFFSRSFSLDHKQRGHGSNRNKDYPHHDGAKTTLVIFHFKFSTCMFVASI